MAAKRPRASTGQAGAGTGTRSGGAAVPAQSGSVQTDAPTDSERSVAGGQATVPAQQVPGVEDPAQELGEQLRRLSAVDPALARQLVADLVVSVDQATDGAFAAQLSPEAREALGLTSDSAS